MKNTLLIILFSSLITTGFSQDFVFEKVDYNKIEKNIKSRKSEFYYKKLFKKFAQGDSTFSLEAKRHLYYGFSFQKKYEPYGSSKYSDSLRIFDNIDSLTENDYKTIIRYANLILDQNPFDLTALNYLAYTYFNLGNGAMEQLNSNKIISVFDAIMSTGDGASEESAFSVIYVSHEYNLIHALDFVFSGEQSLSSNGYDYLKLEENEYFIDGFYFEISRCLKKLNSTAK